MILIQLFIFLALTNQTLASPSSVCSEWFQKSKVSATHPDCIVECSALETGMATMSCNNECEELCQNHCGKILSIWKSRLKDKAPNNWPHKKEKFKAVSPKEISRILKSLSKLPESLTNISIEGVSRADRSLDFPNPATHGVNWIDVNIKGKEMTVDRGSGFVREDGKLGPEEDFANNVEFYLYEKARLKAVTQNAHDWLKEKYGDKLSLRGACEFK